MHSPRLDHALPDRLLRARGPLRISVLPAVFALIAAPGVTGVQAASDGGAAPPVIQEHQNATDDDCATCHLAISEGSNGHSFLLDSPHDGFLCIRCHEMHGATSNLDLILEEIDTPNSGLRAVVFTSYTGPNSFADGDPVYDGICEVCHTSTTYHRNNASGNHSHNVAADCRGCHPHEANFQPTGGGSCLTCHDKTQPYQTGDYRRQVVEQGGDGGGDFVRTSHHVTDGTTTEVITDGDCVVCHDQSNHRTYGDGVSVYLNDPAGGASVLYDGSGSSVEGVCVSCHDGTHLSPFSDGRPAPEVPATWSTSTHKQSGVTCFGSATGCHENAHGSDFQALLQRSLALADYTQYSTGAYELCWLCHSEQAVIFGDNAFEDLHKKHVRDEDAPCMACHDVHAPYDDGEPGLISFEYAVNNGFDFEFIDGHDLSSAFWMSNGGSRGNCYLLCHGKDHKPKEYDHPGGLPMIPTAVGDPDASPLAPVELRAFPSPTPGFATIEIQIDLDLAATALEVTLYDVSGRAIRSLALVPQAAGRRTIHWDGLNDSGQPVESGIYLCRIGSGATQTTCKLVVVR